MHQPRLTELLATLQGVSSAAITGRKGIAAQLAFCDNCKVYFRA